MVIFDEESGCLNQPEKEDTGARRPRNYVLSEREQGDSCYTPRGYRRRQEKGDGRAPTPTAQKVRLRWAKGAIARPGEAIGSQEKNKETMPRDHRTLGRSPQKGQGGGHLCKYALQKVKTLECRGS